LQRGRAGTLSVAAGDEVAYPRLVHVAPIAHTLVAQPLQKSRHVSTVAIDGEGREPPLTAEMSQKSF
jgi:hypothetical protein